MSTDDIINDNDRVLITGANGFIGTRVVDTLLRYGYRNLVCLMRPSGQNSALMKIILERGSPPIEICRGNLLSREDCDKITEGVSVIYHLAAGRGVKSYPDAFLNSVVTTRNLLEAAARTNRLKRFVGVSSFSVYSNLKLRRRDVLDETCEMDREPELRGEAYCYAKVRQDELTVDFCGRNGIPYVLVRPGTVFGPGNRGLPGRIGIDLLGLFLHLGGSNRIPFTYVDNCAEAIVLAGLRPGVGGEVFNVVDDDLPTSREFLNLYKKHVRRFRSIRVPRAAGYLLCSLWEKYSSWSRGQLPPVFNTRRWSNDWKGNRYSNEKLKTRLGWKPRVSFPEASKRFFEHERGL
ncbi:MAG TPA: NAD(P)-dependent oxidoreductase [Syntrophales bacterium]|jgi:nucleoside-diphosphate-sugar epimerase|nr:NAD(P)-dependent oxidoreductase [Syntrophales bacterium]HRT61705.1 NAD(P)-dependent oxidoreductase [Syntrophales bacterium]